VLFQLERAARIASAIVKNSVTDTPLGDEISLPKFRAIALSEADIRKTTEIVRQLSDDVKARS
jgi:hypothetical protein